MEIVHIPRSFLSDCISELLSRSLVASVESTPGQLALVYRDDADDYDGDCLFSITRDRHLPALGISDRTAIECVCA